MNKKVIIIGGEGNGGVIASCIEDNRNRFHDYEWQVYGFLNDYEKGKTINGYRVHGGLDEIDKFLKEDVFFIFAIHMIGRNELIERTFLNLEIPDERFAIIKHKTAFIANNAILEPGVFIMSNAYVGPVARIGKCSLVMANALIGHNTSCGRLCHFSVGSIASSYVQIGKVADVALGAKVLEKRKIGDFGVAGAGSLITKDIPDYEIHTGTPAKFFRRVKDN